MRLAIILTLIFSLVWFLYWHINVCGLFDVKAILVEEFCMIQYPKGRALLVLAVLLVLCTPLFLFTPGHVGISQIVQRSLKKIMNNKQRVEERDRQTWIQNCKTQEGEIGTFKDSCVYLCGAITRTLWKSFTATKDADSSSHHLHCSVSAYLTPYCPLMTALEPCLRAD